MSNTSSAARGVGAGQDVQTNESRGTRKSGKSFGTEDWWAVAIGLFAILVAYALFASGSSIKWLAVAPAKWAQPGQLAADIGKHASGYVALFIAFAAVFSVAIGALGLSFRSSRSS